MIGSVNNSAAQFVSQSAYQQDQTQQNRIGTSEEDINNVAENQTQRINAAPEQAQGSEAQLQDGQDQFSLTASDTNANPDAERGSLVDIAV
ncbi:MAG: hypothetical protein QF692_04300 [Alphaproteobacteria bacterium]|jgi:hypothetical protein|nr:hypothetical protein [Alphaproteobacteria bacterium]MDP7222469.1 hypothetical protein [Alphaproteobacteria bacterium]